MTIRDYLDACGLTLAAFAAEVGVSEAAMSRYARAKRTPRPDILRRIVAASGGRIQPNDLFERPLGGAGAEAGVSSTAPAPAEHRHPAPLAEVRAVDLLVPDLGGTIRGKRVAPDALNKAFANQMRLPASVFALDITGENVPGTGLVWSVGDADKTLSPADGRLRPVPWARQPTAQLLMTMLDDDGAPFFGDPRQVLGHLARRFAETGLKPVIAVELEFYLLDRERDGMGRIRPPRSPATGLYESTTQVYGLEEIDAFSALFADIAGACETQEVPANATVAEYAPGQYEINLDHVADPVAAADHAVLLKRVVKGVARAHGFDATFMAKPYADRPGNGMHLHLSLVDGGGRNLFDGGPEMINPRLRHALGGLVATMAEAMAIFAPNANSYRRFQPGSYAPLAPTWGIENRTVALRVPGGAGASRRIEHRVASADANVYLVIAAVLAGIHHGLETRSDPGERITGNAYEKVAPSLPSRWPEALDRFDKGTVIRDYLGADFSRLYSKVKRHEMAKFDAVVTPLELEWYLRAT